MNGGKLEYLYNKIQFCLESHFDNNTPLRKAFENHMMLVIKALHDIEWVDSKDMKPGDEERSILEVLQDEDSMGLYMEEREKDR